jgi:hypothetical protein
MPRFTTLETQYIIFIVPVIIFRFKTPLLQYNFQHFPPYSYLNFISNSPYLCSSISLYLDFVNFPFLHSFTFSLTSPASLTILIYAYTYFPEYYIISIFLNCFYFEYEIEMISFWMFSLAMRLAIFLMEDGCF